MPHGCHASLTLLKVAALAADTGKWREVLPATVDQRSARKFAAASVGPSKGGPHVILVNSEFRGFNPYRGSVDALWGRSLHTGNGLSLGPSRGRWTGPTPTGQLVRCLLYMRGVWRTL